MWRRTHTTWYLSDDGEALGFQRTTRSGDAIALSCWSIETGFKVCELKRKLLTGWDHQGRVMLQYALHHGALENFSPPWVGGVTDQARPTAPWLDEELSPAEWWERVAPTPFEALPVIQQRLQDQERERRAAIDPVCSRLEQSNRMDTFLRAMRRSDRQEAERILEEVGVTRQQVVEFFLNLRTQDKIDMGY